jgi:uncharacterized protein YcsI (UPF0317 family)
MSDIATMNPRELRELFRQNLRVAPTAGLARGYTQANLAMIPKSIALDFMIFAQRNPKPCPILDVIEAGTSEPTLIAPGADIRTDIPKYRIYKCGELTAEVTDLCEYWREDLVGFLLGCSFTFETALLNAGVPVRHIEERRNVPMYITNVACKPAGVFHGPMVVTMRPIPQEMLIRAIQVTSRFPAVHGAPVHVGNPGLIGIRDLAKPDFGESVTIRPGEVPVFWACGVTPQAVAMAVKPEIMITHAPGFMFICDIRDEELAVF